GKFSPSVLVLAWLVALVPIIAVLETAFWQMKRYQQPMIALLFPMAGWAVLRLTTLEGGSTADTTKFTVHRRKPWITWAALAAMFVIALVTLPNFVRIYADNVREVAMSQMPMARYVAENTPPSAIIGVHDIGVMRYLGGRSTYDVVGLTTPDEARAWRNG